MYLQLVIMPKYSLVILTLPEVFHMCQHRDQPLLLSSHQLSQEIIPARRRRRRERPTAAGQQTPTISRRLSPNEVQLLMISHQQAHAALLRLGKRPKKLEKPQVKPTYHLKKKTQSHHQQVPAPNESDQPGRLLRSAT